MTKTIISILSAFCMTTTIYAKEKVILSEDQAKSIALVHVRGLNLNDDILTIVNTELEAVYSIASVQHLGYDVYQVSVNRFAPGQSCQQTVILNDVTGMLEFKQVLKCEGSVLRN